ncbi:MAG TPA: phenylalanine--tRNA ligase subunit beta [Candidatus Saccharimonadales bacterium]|nr:phenylalanine--tRNA ligase subunit beta [Candidatus Saccharimonadales bacterium]
MKFSVNTIRYLNNLYHAATAPAPDGVEALAKKIGAQLGEIEEITNIGAKYQGVLIVKVVACKKHENSDHLNVCKVDDGGKAQNVERDENGLVQVVCGAANVRADMLAVWLAPGVTVPESYGTDDPFVLEARLLRGVVSNGMLASPRELALGDSHEGILEITDNLEPGTLFADFYGFKDDYIIDVENKMFTHRPDCFGWIGVAREIAGIQHMPYKSPEWYTTNPTFPKMEADELKLDVRNELPNLVPRFTAIALRDVHVGASPLWLQIELAKVGLRSINNVVDLTNLYMLITGQPLHAYDYDKVMAQDANADHATIVVRYPHKSEQITLLSGKTIEPREEAIMIATNDKLIGVGGVMGGADTEVDGRTKNIIIECATFDMYSIRRTSMAHGLFTDAVTRFNKGQSPLQNLAVLAKIVDDVRTGAHGKVASEVIDDRHFEGRVHASERSISGPIKVNVAFINARLGLQLTAQEVAKLLKNVEFDVEAAADPLVVTAPFWRTDIEIPEDIVEEVGRLYGFDHLPLKLPKRSITPVSKDSMLELKSQIREILSKAGANETLMYSFVHGNLLDKVGQNKSLAFQIGNALSPDLQYYRLSLTPSLLDKVHANVKAGYAEFALFELGKAHSTSEIYDDVPEEFDRVALVHTAAQKATGSDRTGAAFYQARTFADELLSRYGIIATYKTFAEGAAAIQGHQYLDEMLCPFEPNRSAMVFNGDRLVGVVGEYRANVHKSLKLPEQTAGFELFMPAFAEVAPAVQYTQLSRFPKIEQDICLKVPATTPYQELVTFIERTLAEDTTYLPEQTRVEVAPLDIYQREDDEAHKQITLRLSAVSYERTLTDEEVGMLLDHIATVANAELNAERV